MQCANQVRPAVLLCLALVASGCSESKPVPPAGPAPAVTVVRVASQQVRASASFTGRVQATDKVDLRARVEGFLEKRQFVEGADVKQGDLLFVIEKGLYQAALDEAKAGLAKAESDLKLADVEFERQKELFARNVGAQAKLDEVTAKQGEARANLLAQKAGVEKAQLQLGYTDITAPIAGRVGRATISVGNFVGPSSAPLATIVSQDPIYVSFPVTQREILEIRRQGDLKGQAEATIRLELADGKPYASTGRINFLDVTVNQGTDTVQVRAVFPNPDRILVDGQLVAVVAERGDGENVLVVPQQALQIDQTGPFILVVDDGEKVVVRRVETGAVRGADIIVRKGLAANERVITEGIQKVRPGQAVQATELKPAG
jgi:membrane fusion protein (multidrug efflux system)